MKSAIMLVLSLSIIFDAYAQRTNVSKLQSSNTVIAIHYFAGGGNFNSKLYYQRLIEWIEKSPYKKNCKSFLENIEPWGKK